MPQEPDPQSPQSASMPQAPDPQSPQSTSMRQAPDPQSSQSTSMPQAPDPQSPQSTSMPQAPDPQSSQSTSMPQAPDPQSPQSTSMPQAPDPQPTEMSRVQMLSVLNTFGPYQRRLLMLLLYPLIMSGYTYLSVIVNFYSPGHRCRVPGLANDSYSIQNDAHRMTVNLSIPMTSSGEGVSYSECDVYKDRGERYANRTLYDVTEPCHSWVYDNTDFERTIVTQAKALQSLQSTTMPQKPDPGSPQPTEMSHVQMLAVLNTFGPYQRRLLMLLLYPLTMSGYTTNSVILIFYSPDHRCRVPGLANDSYSIQSDAHRMMVNLSIPMTSYDGDITYRKCDVYKDYGERHAHGTLNNFTEPCHSWVYDKTDFERTIVTQFDLVCENKGFRAIFNTVFMLGLLVGSAVSGILCDRFGRKKVFMACILLGMLTIIAMAFPVVTPMLLVYRFLAGSLGMAAYLSLYVLSLEFMGVSQRTLAGSLMMVLYLPGSFLVAGLSYVIRDWRWLQVLNGVPFIFLVSYWWLLDESPRWLLAKGHVQEAQKVILKIIKVNNMTLPVDNNLAVGDALDVKDFQQHRTSEEKSTHTRGNNQAGSKDMTASMEEQPKSKRNKRKTREDKQQTVSVDKENKAEVEEEEQVPPESPLKLFKYPNLIARTAIIFSNWAAVSTTYFGISLNVANLDGDVRVIFILSNLMDLLGSLAAWTLLDRLGRKRTHCAAMFLSGTSFLASLFSVLYGDSDLHWLTILLDMVGKLGISAALSTVYLLSGELFPTVMRNIGMGCSSTVGRAATVLSPYIADLSLHIEGKLGTALPPAIFGSLGLAAGLLALCLPETLNRKLPDTITEAANFTKQKPDDPAHVQQATTDRKHSP